MRAPLLWRGSCHDGALLRPGVLYRLWWSGDVQAQYRLLFETDCPYMAPEPIRGLECEPAMIGLTARALINDRVDRTGESAQVIAQAAWDNAQRLFADRPAV